MRLEERLAVYRDRLQELEKEPSPDEERRKFLQAQIDSTLTDLKTGVQYPIIEYPQKKRYTTTDSVERIQSELLNGKLVHISPRMDWKHGVWVHELEIIPYF